MSLAKEMWDYLKSIGFEDISDSDKRLGCFYSCAWRYNIARNNLCAYCDKMDDFIGFTDTSKSYYGYMINIKSLKIRSVSDLEAWLRKEYPEFFTVEQHQYKVGDKVRILEDAVMDGVGNTVVQECDVNYPLHKGVGFLLPECTLNEQN